MVLGWRRVFCTSVHKDRYSDEKQHCNTNSPKISSKLGFFSNPSTPRLPLSNSSPNSPTLHTKPETPKKKSSESPRLFSPSSPSFSLLKSTLRISTKRSVCGICSEAVKSGRGTAIFTGECCHDFHFPCIAYHFKTNPLLQCPVCNASWKQPPLLPILDQQKPTSDLHSTDLRHVKIKPLRVYDDDEPLVSPTAGARFNPIPESDEEDDDGPTEFQGFFVNPNNHSNNVVVNLIPEVAVGRGSETCVVRMKVKAPPGRSGMRRPPIDLVALLQVGGSTNMETLKRAMGLLISSLSESDRLSIVAFSGGSKRLLPLRRMSTGGHRAARGILDALRRSGDGMCVGDAIKKAAKVLEDRRHKNSTAGIVLFSDGRAQRGSSTSLSHADLPVHAVDVGACGDAPPDATLGGLLSFVSRDLRLQLGFGFGPGMARVVAVYSLTGKPEFLGSDMVRLGDFVAEEERELLVEFTCPSGPHRIMSVRPSFKDASSGVLVYSKEQALVVPWPQAVRSLSPSIERLRNLHVTVRAVAESRRLIERDDFAGAHRLLSSARAVLMKSRSAEELLRGLEAEEAKLHRRWLKQREGEKKGEAVTPTSAWRAAEKLAKLAVMKKSMNRVSDLHGFENARF